MSLTIELLLHPIRMRIIQAFMPDKQLTAGQLSEVMTDIPQASLYRHLAIMLKANVIEVVAEQRVRGTVEKTYRLKQATFTREQVENMSPEEHTRAFFTFTTHLLSQFERYVHQEDTDFYRDGVSYRQAAVYLDDEEFTELMQQIGKLMMKANENKPRDGRKLRTIANIVIPDA